MNESKASWDLWSIPTALLWLIFFFAGLDPETLFHVLRELGGVVTQEAIVNSPHLVTIGFAAYIGLFAYHRCLEAGLNKIDAKARSLQHGVIALVAFLNFSPLHVLSIAEIPVQNYRLIVLLVTFSKITAWFYLLIVIMRYYILGQDKVFSHMTSLFPSTRTRQESEEQLGEQKSITWLEAKHPSHEMPGTLEPKDRAENS